MQTTLLLVVKIGLLVLLWFFIWMTIRALRKDTVEASGVAPKFGAASGFSGPNERTSLRNTFSRSKPPSYLELTSGPLTGTTINFQGYEEITIGRSSSCTLQLDDDFASGTHARLIRRGRDWFVEDQDSRNCTWVNGQRLDQPERLTAGMELRIGQTQVRMER